MCNRLPIALLLILPAITLPGLARAVELPQGSSGPPLITSPSGFVGVPSAGDTRQGGIPAFPPPAKAKAPACPSCPAPEPAQPPQH